MIFNGSVCSNCDLAQTGSIRLASWGSNTYFFYECANNTTVDDFCKYEDGSSVCPCDQQLGLMMDPLNRSYYDQYSTWLDLSNPHEVHMKVTPTGDPAGQIYNSPNLYIDWTPNYIEALAEVHNQVSQTTGTTASHNYVQNLQFLRSGTWTDANLNSGFWAESTAKYGAADIMKATEFDVWDTRY